MNFVAAALAVTFVTVTLCIVYHHLHHRWRVRNHPRFYVGTGLARAAEAQRVAQQLKADGWTHTYDWTVHGSVAARSPADWPEIAAKEINGVTEADVAVILLPGGRGTHAELGAALGMNIPVVLVASQEDLFEAPTFPGSKPGFCLFHHHPGITLVRPGDNAALLRAVRDALSEVA